MKLPIYLDYSATTPVDPRVAQKMIPYLTEHFGNPASRSHSFGWTTEAAVEEARNHVAALVNCDPKEIVWTSGATEAINLALKGAAHFYRDKGKHLVTVKTEHKATLDTMRELEREGYEVTYLDVMENGLLDLDAFKAALRPDTSVVSVMYVNNEIGVVQDVAAIGEICRARGIIFHVDGAQASGKVPIDLAKLKVDLMSFSAHKTYGPKGIGALVRPPQAARAHRSADARWRPRARHAFRHAGDAPDPRDGRGVPARQGRRWRPRTSASGCCATSC
jgi:cysteine desulfurase